MAELFYREAGTGPGVVCLHANASTSAQWRPLMSALASDFHVFAPDAYGAGQSPAWPTDHRASLRDEAALLEPVFERAGESFALVGHSYGAAVALLAAVAQSDRISALAVFEPVLFSVVDAACPTPNAVDGLKAVRARAVAALDVGDTDRAAELFTDYWTATGTWASMPADRKPAITAAIKDLPRWADALLHDPTPLAAFAALHMPILYMIGSDSPASSQAVAALLTPTLPNVEVMEFDAIGHMGPVTHPHLVNQAIRNFLTDHHNGVPDPRPRAVAERKY